MVNTETTWLGGVAPFQGVAGYDMIEEQVPGRDDPSSVPIDERIGRYAAYLRDFLTFDEAILQLAGHAISLKELVEKDQIMEDELRRVASDIEQQYGDLHDLAIGSAQRGRLSAERFLKVLNLQSSKRKKVSANSSVAGKKSGDERAKNAKAPPQKVLELYKKQLPSLGKRSVVGAIARQLGVSAQHIRTILKENQN